MGFTKALYYPTIDIHNEDWLKTAMLFWDEINTIVPESVTQPYEFQTTQYLHDEGLLRPLIVHSDFEMIEDLTKQEKLNSNPYSYLLAASKQV